MSLTEGEDKPLKYPAAFMAARVVVITKTDLEPYVDARAAVMSRNVLSCNPGLRVVATSAKTGEGIDELAGFFIGSIDDLLRNRE